MIDHIGFPVSDYPRAKAFYLKALAPLGYSLVMEVTQEQNDGMTPAGRLRRQWQTGFLDRRRRRLEQAVACRDRRQGPRHGRRFLPGGDGGGRTR